MSNDIESRLSPVNNPCGQLLVGCPFPPAIKLPGPNTRWSSAPTFSANTALNWSGPLVVVDKLISRFVICEPPLFETQSGRKYIDVMNAPGEGIAVNWEAA